MAVVLTARLFTQASLDCAQGWVLVLQTPWGGQVPSEISLVVSQAPASG